MNYRKIVALRLAPTMWRVTSLPLVTLLIATVVGCAPVHFTVTSAPVRPEDAGRYAFQTAEVPVRVQVANFEIRQVDTQYPKREKDLFRRHFAVAIPNMLQEHLGKRQMFSEVTRVASAKAESTDYVLDGTYDYFDRIGTQGREWIPFVGTFGADINESWVKETLVVRLMETKSGKTVFERGYPEERRDRTSIYKKAKVGYLQAEYLGKITSDIINAISEHWSVAR